MANILDQLQYQGTYSIDEKAVVGTRGDFTYQSRTAIPAGLTYRGLVVYDYNGGDTSTTGALYIYTGEDGTNTAAAWQPVAHGGSPEQNTNAVEDFPIGLANGQTFTIRDGETYFQRQHAVGRGLWQWTGDDTVLTADNLDDFEMGADSTEAQPWNPAGLIIIDNAPELRSEDSATGTITLNTNVSAQWPTRTPIYVRDTTEIVGDTIDPGFYRREGLGVNQSIWVQAERGLRGVQQEVVSRSTGFLTASVITVNDTDTTVTIGLDGNNLLGIGNGDTLRIVATGGIYFEGDVTAISNNSVTLNNLREFTASVVNVGFADAVELVEVDGYNRIATAIDTDYFFVDESGTLEIIEQFRGELATEASGAVVNASEFRRLFPGGRIRTGFQVRGSDGNLYRWPLATTGNVSNSANSFRIGAGTATQGQAWDLITAGGAFEDAIELDGTVNGGVVQGRGEITFENRAYIAGSTSVSQTFTIPAAATSPYTMASLAWPIFGNTTNQNSALPTGISNLAVETDDATGGLSITWDGGAIPAGDSFTVTIDYVPRYNISLPLRPDVGTTVLIHNPSPADRTITAISPDRIDAATDPITINQNENFWLVYFGGATGWRNFNLTGGGGTGPTVSDGIIEFPRMPSSFTLVQNQVYVQRSTSVGQGLWRWEGANTDVTATTYAAHVMGSNNAEAVHWKPNGLIITDQAYRLGLPNEAAQFNDGDIIYNRTETVNASQTVPVGLHRKETIDGVEQWVTAEQEASTVRRLVDLEDVGELSADSAGAGTAIPILLRNVTSYTWTGVDVPTTVTFSGLTAAQQTTLTGIPDGLTLAFVQRSDANNPIFFVIESAENTGGGNGRMNISLFNSGGRSFPFVLDSSDIALSTSANPSDLTLYEIHRTTQALNPSDGFALTFNGTTWIAESNPLAGYTIGGTPAQGSIPVATGTANELIWSTPASGNTGDESALLQNLVRSQGFFLPRPQAVFGNNVDAGRILQGPTGSGTALVDSGELAYRVIGSGFNFRSVFEGQDVGTQFLWGGPNPGFYTYSTAVDLTTATSATVPPASNFTQITDFDVYFGKLAFEPQPLFYIYQMSTNRWWWSLNVPDLSTIGNTTPQATYDTHQYRTF